MVDENYTAREINILLEPINEKLDVIFKQVTETNGRVTRLERWKSFIHGGMAILSLMVVPVMLYVVIGWLK